MFAVLHLEQSDLIKRMVYNVLTERGYTYIPVDTPQEAYSIINKEKLDLIVTSKIFQNETIENFLKSINTSINKHTPVFIVTSDDINDSNKTILDLGVSDYISKRTVSTEIVKHIQVLRKSKELMTELVDSNIAIIDDNKFDRDYIGDILIKSGLKNIDYYSSGEELFKNNKTYDLYLVDMILKDDLGKNIIMQIRRNNINSSIIVISSLSGNKTISNIINSGANDFISKPIEEDLLIAKIRSNMRSYTYLKKIEELYIDTVK